MFKWDLCIQCELQSKFMKNTKKEDGLAGASYASLSRKGASPK